MLRLEAEQRFAILARYALDSNHVGFESAKAIEQGLVDEFRMFRCPIAVGGGTPYLPPITSDLPLELIETRRFDNQVVYERYGVS